MVIIQLSKDENDKLISFLKEEQGLLSKRSTSLEREQVLVEKVLNMTPAIDNKAWNKEVVKNMKLRGAVISQNIEDIEIYNKLISSIIENKEFTVPEFIKDRLMKLYHTEKTSKIVERKYTYYPRLKRAKEAAMYVFANKIKQIMEVKNVKFA